MEITNHMVGNNHVKGLYIEIHKRFGISFKLFWSCRSLTLTLAIVANYLYMDIVDKSKIPFIYRKDQRK